jgi:RimJ/RimL family protein N-acetyltransferase
MGSHRAQLRAPHEIVHGRNSLTDRRDRRATDRDRQVGGPGKGLIPTRWQPSDRYDTPSDLSRVRLGPERIGGQTVILRRPRFDDFTEWRQIRLRNQRLIEPFWVTSPLDWSSRHSERVWVHEWLAQRDGARRGRDLSMVIEVNGRFAGQFDLGSIDVATRTAELGIWVDADVARHGVGGLAASMMLDFAFGALRLERITAPISPENVATSNGAVIVGLVCEGVMADYFDAGGRRKDHALWAATSQTMPPGGFTHHWVRRFESANAGSRIDEPSTRPRPNPHVARAGCRRIAKRLIWTACYYAGELRHRFNRLRPGRPVVLRQGGAPAVVLRAPRLSDYAARREFRVQRAAAGSHRVAAAADAKTSWGRMRWFMACAQARRGFRAAGELRLVIDVDGQFGGECGLSHLDMFDRNATMHVCVSPDPAARWVATAATGRLLDYALGPLKLIRVAMAIPPDNIIVADAAARVGMVREATMRWFLGPDGRRRDHDLWAATSRTVARH